MKIEVKNLLYQPIGVIKTDGTQDSIKARKKRYFKDTEVVMSYIDKLKQKEKIKVKTIQE